MQEEPPEVLWRGMLIAESLKDPTLINELRVSGARISREELPLDDAGHLGRWHLYWVDVTPEQIEAIREQLKPGWYAHFWAGDRMVVVFDDARFDLDRFDRSGWAPAIEHGLRRGLRREWLDFPTDDSAGASV